MESSNIELHARNRKLEKDLETFRTSENSLKANIISLEESLSSKKNELENLQKSFDNTKVHLEERILYLQMQQMKEVPELKKQNELMSSQNATLKQKIEEKDIAIRTNKEFCQALQTRVIGLESEIEKCRDKNREYEKALSLNSVTIKDCEETINRLNLEFESVAFAKDDALKRIKELEDYKLRCDSQLVKLTVLIDQNESLTAALEDKTSLVTRLRSEAQANERNHAMRTAMLATCEAQLESMQQELATKVYTLKESQDKVNLLQQKVAAAELKLLETVKEFEVKVLSYESDINFQRKQFEESLKDEKSKCEESLENARKEYLKKSNLARSMLTEKEEENKLLSMKVCLIYPSLYYDI